MDTIIDAKILAQHLSHSGDWGAAFKCTPLIIDIFARRKIFFGRNANRFAPSDILIFEAGVEVEPYASFNKDNSLWNAGAFSYFESWLPPGTEVGRYCSVGPFCFTLLERHPVEWATTSSVTYDIAPPEHPLPRKGYESFLAAHKDFGTGDFTAVWPPRHLEPAPRIGHDVWIGQDVRLRRGITVGTGAVIAAGAVVTKDVEPYTIVGGVSAKVIKRRFDEKLTERFLASSWWEYDVRVFTNCDHKNPAQFLDDLERVKNEGSLLPYAPEKITFHHILTDLIAALASAQ